MPINQKKSVSSFLNHAKKGMVMNYNLLNIKNILLFFVVVIALIVLCSIILFINKHSQLQNQFAYFKFEQSVTALAQQLDKEIELGKQNVYRLKKYVSILDSKSENMNDKIAFLQNLMADNLQFEKNHYSHYIAIEPYLSLIHISEPTRPY